MAEYPTEFEFDVLLKNGQVIHIRPIQPDDVEREARFIRRVGPESAYFRFFNTKRELSPAELAHFTNVDYDDRMALIATVGDDMVAVGRYDVLGEETAADGGKVAEVAFLVEDSHQQLGIGSRLLQDLTVYARTRGITEFEAYVLAENVGMMRLFRNSGYRMTRRLDEGIYRVEFPLDYSREARQAEWEHEKRAVAASLLPLFYPSSVAVIGASRNPTSIGGRLFANLVDSGFTGSVHPVNPGADEIHGVATVASVAEIDGHVDLAVITVPAEHVRQAVEDCGRAGVRGVVIISAGFGEVGNTDAEQELVTLARRYGMRLVGPNCMGLLNADPTVSLNVQFGPNFPPHGNVAMSSQSGALGLAILEQTAELGIGISTFVSVGNRADVSANDLLLYWEDDPATDVILLYTESFGNPRRFGRLARQVTRKKPVVVVKAGRSAAGARAAASHTGSLANLDVAVDALFRRAGVIRTNTLHELFEVTELLANQPLPTGRRVAVLTNAGGPGILAADALESHGLELPTFSEELQRRLGAHLSGMAAPHNPVDMIASAGPEEYRRCLELLLESDEIDAVVAIYIPTAPEGTEEIVAAIRETVAEHPSDKPTVGVFMGSLADDEHGSIPGSNLPVFPFPESAARALASANRYREWLDKDEGTLPHFDDLDAAAARGAIRGAVRRLGTDEGGWLDSNEIRAVLGAYGLPTVAERMAHSEDEAAAAADEIDGPLVVKVVSPTALHKSDLGGVVLDVEGSETVRAAYRQVTGAVDDAAGVVIQQFVPNGHEVIIGMTEDPTFGPLIVFGLGGIFVELMKDVAFRINPLTDVDARDMMSEVRSAQLLEGYRGGTPGDLNALEEVLLRLSVLVEQLPEITEIDLNPVKVLPPGEGAVIVDARIRVRPVTGIFLPSRKDIPGRML
ncbi:MAG: GNAT family N-acetyltransferase [Acidimicrobiia bacterium]|nr:GNAT family N-acetyltransferase [Acidimicrobiia bacterium]